jgi:hypothetical protein
MKHRNKGGVITGFCFIVLAAAFPPVRDGFVVSGRLYEFEGCVGYQRGWTVMLEPPGLSATTNVASGYFEFPDITDGEYTIIAVPDCNPFGCWPETALTVAGGDIYVDICPDAVTPTPSQTPTPTPSPNCTPIVCYLIRELPDHACTDDEITVNLVFYGDSYNCSIMSVEETVPDGWVVLDPPWDEQEGNTYIWNEPIDAYSIQVGGPFLAEFSGSAVTWDTCDGTMTKTTQGDVSMWIPLSETSWLNRTLPDTCAPGESFTVYLSQQGGPALIIQTSETLPDGWTVTEPDDFEQQGGTFTWDRLVPEYTVLVPADAVPGEYDINGHTLSSYTCPTDPFQHVITGDNTVTVTDPEPTPTYTPVATPTPSCPDDICLELRMPGTAFGPGSIFYLDLVVMNTGSYRDDAQVFIALTAGTGDFWFYPFWVRFPPEIDWETTDIPDGLNDIWTILPEFTWPHGAGEYSGAMFFAAVLHEGMLVSNLADITFGWTD